MAGERNILSNASTILPLMEGALEVDRQSASRGKVPIARLDTLRMHFYRLVEDMWPGLSQRDLGGDFFRGGQGISLVRSQVVGVDLLSEHRDAAIAESVLVGLNCLRSAQSAEISDSFLIGHTALDQAREIDVRDSLMYGWSMLRGSSGLIERSIVGGFDPLSQLGGVRFINTWVVDQYGARYINDETLPKSYTQSVNLELPSDGVPQQLSSAPKDPLRAFRKFIEGLDIDI